HWGRARFEPPAVARGRVLGERELQGLTDGQVDRAVVMMLVELGHGAFLITVRGLEDVVESIDSTPSRREEGEDVREEPPLGLADELSIRRPVASWIGS